MTNKKLRRVYLAFEFEKDAILRKTFVFQAGLHCDYDLEDLSLPFALHDSLWHQEALKRIRKADIVFVLLGPDTHNAPGVHDELSLAGQSNVPIVQVMPQGKKYGLVSHRLPLLSFKWKSINELLRNPKKISHLP